jgi:hypothetical protein
MMKLLRLAYSNASFIVGLITGAAGLASNLASIFGIELNGFPGILIGYYRTLVAQLFFWSPDWWPEWLSHLITLYLALGLSLARAVGSISKPTAMIKTMLTHLVFWPFYLISMISEKHKYDKWVFIFHINIVQEILIVASLTPIFAVFLLVWSGLEHQLSI